MLRVETSLNAARQRDLLFRVEQGDLADLLQVRADGVGRRRELGVLSGLAKGGGLFLVPDGAAFVFLVIIVVAGVVSAELRGDVVVIVALVELVFGVLVDEDGVEVVAVEVLVQIGVEVVAGCLLYTSDAADEATIV